MHHFHVQSLQYLAVRLAIPDRRCTADLLTVSFPAESQLKKGEKATIFNVSPSVWDTEPVGHGNCTSVLVGTNFLTNESAPIPTMWLLGAAFFAGHYIDFDIASSTVSYANLKNPATGM